MKLETLVHTANQLSNEGFDIYAISDELENKFEIATIIRGKQIWWISESQQPDRLIWEE